MIVTSFRNSLVLILIIFSNYTLADNKEENFDIPAEFVKKFTTAEDFREQRKFDLSYSIYKELKKELPKNFLISYSYGRLLAQMKRFNASFEELQVALTLGEEKEHLPEPSIHNTMGWVSLMSDNYDQALEQFTIAKEDYVYTKLSERTKMKLHNNTGYTLMLLDRYDESLKEFELASNLGSYKAKLNIEKVQSLINTQENQNPDLPGVFAVVVGSAKYETRINNIIKTASKVYAKELEEFDTYLAKTGRYFITIGSNYSYTKARQIKNKINEQGIIDVFVSSTTSWSPYKFSNEITKKTTESLTSPSLSKPND